MARIFLVEDDMTVAALLRHSIAAQDHEVMHFTNAEDCIGNMGLRPDIISIDSKQSYLPRHHNPVVKVQLPLLALGSVETNICNKEANTQTLHFSETE